MFKLVICFDSSVESCGWHCWQYHNVFPSANRHERAARNWGYRVGQQAARWRIWLKRWKGLCLTSTRRCSILETKTTKLSSFLKSLGSHREITIEWANEVSQLNLFLFIYAKLWELLIWREMWIWWVLYDIARWSLVLI